MTNPQIFSVLAMLLGESLCIVSEVMMARRYSWSITFLLITLAGAPLLWAYRYGYAAFRNIWVVMVVSMVSILVAEPLVILFFFEIPTRGAMMGFCCGVNGFVLAACF